MLPPAFAGVEANLWLLLVHDVSVLHVAIEMLLLLLLRLLLLLLRLLWWLLVLALWRIPAPFLL